eukprot:XP_001694427.1 predicted protein [Chlamydomonas reinhardtii]
MGSGDAQQPGAVISCAPMARYGAGLPYRLQQHALVLPRTAASAAGVMAASKVADSRCQNRQSLSIRNYPLVGTQCPSSSYPWSSRTQGAPEASPSTYSYKFSATDSPFWAFFGLLLTG